MPSIVWFLGGLVGGWCLRSLINHREITANLREETGQILDGISRMHRAGALGAMKDLRLKHGDRRNNVQLLVRSKEYDDGYADLDNLDLYND
jgi:hypothetical protein